MQYYEDECYDITQAISRIEEELIASFMRNFKRHKAEETELGYNWSAWQVEMMKSLEEYSRENRKKYPIAFRKLNDRIDALIDMAREDGQGEEEARILEAIRKGIHIEKASESLTGSFFALNDKKIDALKKSVRNDMEKAEIATLRRVDDVYRKTIFDTQVYASTGAGTYEKAVDMAVKDFLIKGIDSVEYKNGTRHSISDYADMAIRTASKRAYFTGEGEKRAQYGEHLVKVNRRGAGDSHAGSSVCGHCAKWAGKVLIDDVWSGGSKADGDYPLMSQAIADGLYHPRCKDAHTTYFDDGFDEEYDKEKQAEEQKKIVEEHNEEEKARYAERQVKKYGRLADNSLAEENKEKYKKKKSTWLDKLKGLTKSSKYGKNKEEQLPSRPKRKQLETGYDGKIPNEALEEFNAKALTQIIEDTGYSEEKARKLHSALIDYFGGDYESIELSPNSEKAKIIMEGLNKMPAYDGKIYRGLSFYKNDVGFMDFSMLKPGEELPSRNCIESWSSSIDAAFAGYAAPKDYNSHAVLIECVENTSGAGTQHISAFGKKEAEVTVCNQLYEVLEVKMETKYDYFTKDNLFNDAKKVDLWFKDDIYDNEIEMRGHNICRIIVKEKR